MKVVDRDGDIWVVRYWWFPPLRPWPSFMAKASQIGKLQPPAGVDRWYYDMTMRGGVFQYLVVLWPLVLLAHLLAWLLSLPVWFVNRLLDRRPALISAVKQGPDKDRLLRWTVQDHSRVREIRRQIEAALKEGRGLYSIDGAELLDEPLWARD